MITRLFVDNYRCLQNFEWKPASEVLMLGYNGTGKTSIFDAIDLIRSWASGWDRLEDLLTDRELTRWSDSEEAKFEIDFDSGEKAFRYRVEFQRRRRGGNTTLLHETLHIGKKVVFIRNGTVVSVKDGELDVVAKFSIPANQSAVASIAASDHSEFCGEFLDLLSSIVVVRPMPPLMKAVSRKPDNRASFRFENFVAWFQNWAAQGQFSHAWLGLLNEVWEDFDYTEFEKLGRDETGLNVVFRRSDLASGKLKLEFQELSDGQQMLIVLYALLAYEKSALPTTIIIDEPDNFVALSEIQPWLLRMLNDKPRRGQLIVASHNAEIMTTMGVESVAYTSRLDHVSPTTIRGLSDDDSGLLLPERLKLGWIEPASGRNLEISATKTA